MQIDLLVPIIVESEFLPLDESRAGFASIGCRLALPSREIVERTGDKLAFAEFLSAIGVPGPATSHTPKTFPSIAFQFISSRDEVRGPSERRASRA